MVTCTTYVCRADGVEVSTSRSGKLVHVGELPDGTPEHEIDITCEELWEAKFRHEQEVKSAFADLMQHHAALHPTSDCPWLRRVSELLRTRT